MRGAYLAPCLRQYWDTVGRELQDRQGEAGRRAKYLCTFQVSPLAISKPRYSSHSRLT
jgi:hypothetical protein